MAKHRRQEVDEEVEDDGAERRRGKSKRQRGGSWLWWIGSRLFVLFVLLGVLLYFVPVLIGSTGVWKTLLATAAPEIAKQVDAKSLTLSWLSPIELQGLVVRDVAGQPLAEVMRITSRKSLLGIALNHQDVGTFEVEEPKAKIVLRADGSNVEDLLAKLPKSESKGGDLGFGLVLTKGSVELDDQVAGRQWRLENLAVEVNSPLAKVEKKSGKLGATLLSATAASSPAQIGAEFVWTPSQSEKTSLGSGQVSLALQGLPTEIVEGALRRFGPDVRPRGPLTVQLAGNWDGANAKLQLVQLTTPGIAVSAPKLLGTDQPNLVITSGKANILVQENVLSVQELELLTNVLTINGKGAAALHSSPRAPREGHISRSEMATIDDVEIRSEVKLADLARQLPATLRLKADTQVNSGVAELVLASKSGADGRLWTGSLKTRDLRGIAGGRQIQFDQPLVIDFGVRQTASGPVIERLVGRASFLRLEGRGGLKDGNVIAEADLDKLVAELEKLIDFRDTRLAGNLGSEIRWKHDEQQGWNANADIVLQNFEVRARNLAPWTEPKLHLAADVQGKLAGGTLAEVNAGKLLVEAGNDRLDAELTQSVKTPSEASEWPIKFHLRGDLDAWSRRMQPFVPLEDWKIAGTIDAAGTANVSSKVADLGQATIEIANLDIGRPPRAQRLSVGITAPPSPGLAIREPVVKLETGGAWSFATSTLTLGSTTLASSTVAFRADGVRATLGKERSIVGTIDFRGDLGKLTSWVVTPEPPRSQMSGGITGHLDMGYRGQSLAATWTADVENLSYQVAPPQQPQAQRASLASNQARPAWQTLWNEPKISIAGQGMFDPAAGTLKIERTSVAASVASLAASGTVTKLTSAPEIDLSGEIAYDLDQVTQQIQSHARRDAPSGEAALPYGLDTLQLTGKEKRQFVLKGPLQAVSGTLTAARQTQTATTGRGFELSDALAGEASMGWQGAQYVGLVAGAADFRAKLNNQVVSVGPLDIPISEGRLTMAPRLMLSGREQAIVVDRGPVLTNVRISPEMCSLWLKFVAPMLADTTRAEGKFSLSLEGANVPLATPANASVAGTLAIQSAQVGPGPTALPVVDAVNKVRGFFDGGANAAAGGDPNRGWLVLPPQDVVFEVRDGWVTNQGLKFSVGDAVVTTAGRVHIASQQMELLMSVPMQDSWFKRQDSLFASLKGQTISIPVTGTLKQPSVDVSRVLQELGKQFAGGALRGVIGQQLERGLQGIGGAQPPGTTPPSGTQPGTGLPRGVEGLLPGGLGQGLNRLFGQPPAQPQQPQQPAPQQPAAPTRPR